MKGSPVRLRSLAPEYVESQHDSYVRHLQDAIENPKNKNIALTGRYGAGKSSVLDEFESKNKGKTLRISINTLGPDAENEDLTNRIQKELVKQLVYRAEPGKVRRSRFARVRPLTKKWALVQAAGVTAVILALLWLLGVRPDIGGIGPDESLFWQLLSSSAFFALVVIVVFVARWFVGDRIVSQVATVGTTVTLGEKPDTYFDKFLDEIVTFFDVVNPEFVIFEDLDRFDDPRIFESLRELNTLINASAHWKHKDQPVRFIYAIKDSLFEQLGSDFDVHDHRETTDRDKSDASGVGLPPRVDLAKAAVERANRTKFFELVIPVVPFISHRNARDHLADSLKRLGFSADVVKRPLLDLVARHTTDMRLLINICNEFAVFGEHLLWVDNAAPRMTADDLFALVAYKNFHLADFESIPQRGSSLDALEQQHRQLVRSSIERRQKQKRELVRTEEAARRQDRTAEALGQRLRAFAAALPGQVGGRRYDTFLVAGESHQLDTVITASFWKEVADTGKITISHAQTRHGPAPVTLDSAQLAGLFPEGVNSDRWRDPTADEYAKQIQQYDRDIAFLRGADFGDLARDERFTLEGKTFKDFIAEGLDSELARDLVRRGFIGRNYAEYSATFYGSFVGVDVAFYYNHSVQPNQMHLDYEFTTPNAIAILLEQVPEDFTSSVSVLNVQIIDHLLNHDTAVAKKAIAFIVDDHSSHAQTFLDAFLNSPDVSQDRLVAMLTAHPWSDVFDYLARHDGIPDQTTRVKLLDAALLSAKQPGAYKLNDGTRSLLATGYPALQAFAQEHSPERTKTILAFAQDADLVVADLEGLGEPLRELIIAERMYELTTHNLRTALNIDTPPTLDEVREVDDVWDYCRANLDLYLAAMREDEQADSVVQTPTVLGEVVNEQRESWREDQLREMVSMSAPSAALPDLSMVPSDVWPIFVDAGRVAPTAANVSSYAATHGVDENLARFLVTDDKPVEFQSVEETDVATRNELATSIMNASSVLGVPDRVHLVVSLALPGHLEVTDLVPTDDDLLARALEANLVPDEPETFAHFLDAGWASVADAFAASEKIAAFMTPELVSGVVADLLASNKVPDEIRGKVVKDLPRYVPDDDAVGLRAAGKYAREKRLKLSLEDAQRIARATKDPDLVLRHLVTAREASADELIEVMALLGPPYSFLVDGSGSEFDLPAGSSNNTLFERLQATGRVQIYKDGRRGSKKVRSLN